MNIYFLLLELFIYIFVVYLFLKKKELSILYLPVLFFADTVITNPLVPAVIFYAVISLLLFRIIKENTSFLNNNIFSGLIILYFLILITRSKNLSVIKGELLFNVMFLFMSLPLIISVYKKYSREVIFKELSQSAFFILLIFITNVTLSTLLNYNVHFMYGISSGILYGNLYATDFNILSITVFLVVLSFLEKKNIIYTLVFLLSLCFIGVSLRRTVMAMSLLGVVFSVLLVLRHNMKRVIIFGSFALLIGGLIAIKTDLIATFNERYELRKLDDRDIEEEKRFIEYELLYDDMFVYGRYSPWFGFELLNSAGNYGGGIFYDRTLHGDLTSIVHSSGIIGLCLYILMVISAFSRAFKAAKTRNDKILTLFCLIDFVTYTLSGRYTEYGGMLLIFLAASLPLAKKEEEDNVLEIEYIDSSYARI